MTNIKDPKNDKWRRIVANFISAINMYAWLQRMIRTQAHLRCEQIFSSAGRLLVAGAPVADWGGVSTWGQEGLSCHPPPAGQPDLELGDLHHLHVGFLVYLHL